MAKSRREFLRGISATAFGAGLRPVYFVIADSTAFLGAAGEIKVLQFYQALGGGGGS